MPISPVSMKPEILTDKDLQAESMVKVLEKVSWLMDRAIPIPGTNLRVGLDAVIGLIPGGGDFVAGLIQTAIVVTAVHHYKVPKAVAARMASNVLLDTAVGAIPLVGDAFDAIFKANTRNMKLLTEVRDLRKAGQPVSSGASIGYLIGLATLLVGTLSLVLIGLGTVIYFLARSIWR